MRFCKHGVVKGTSTKTGRLIARGDEVACEEAEHNGDLIMIVALVPKTFAEEARTLQPGQSDALKIGG